MNTAEIALVRYYFTKGYTSGRMFLDGSFLCYTLEDEVREVEGQTVMQWKVPRETAIPRGRYEVVLTMSPKFGRLLPELRNVRGYTGVRIHSGNRVNHTEGCPLVGLADGNDRDAFVGNSRVAEAQVIAKIDAEIKKGKRVFITVV